MSLLDQLLAILAPHTCVGCGRENTLLCSTCAGQLVLPVDRCYRCHKLTVQADTCLACRQHSHLRSVQSAYRYQGAAKELVWKLKSAGAQAAAKQMANQILRHCPPLPAAAIIVPVPTATSRVRRRGYDQAELLARQLAAATGLRYMSCLVRTGQAEQVGAGREQRLSQLTAAFRAGQLPAIQGQHLILIDDVVTTGATLEAAAKTLQAAGADRVDALVFAQA